MCLPVSNLVIGACTSAAFASLLLLLWQLSSFLFARRAASSCYCYSFVVEKQHLSDGIFVVNWNN